MPPSIWSDLTQWAEESYEDAKDWAQSAFDHLKGSDQVSTSTDVSSAYTATATATSLPTHTISRLPIISTDVESSPLSSSSSTSTLPVETGLPTSSQVVAASSSHSGLRGNMSTMVLCFAGGIIASIVVYLLTPVVIRFCQFAYNFTSVFLSRNSSSSFTRDSELGFSSEEFSLTRNIDVEDERNGLDKSSKLKLLWYMFFYGETFDEARLRLVRNQFAKNGIGPDGQPLDPKFLRQE